MQFCEIEWSMLVYINYYLHIGLVYAVDGLKSIILTLATTARIINIPEAVNLSRLEEEYQVYIISIGFVIKMLIVRGSILFSVNIYVSDMFLLYIIIIFFHT